ncbi:MAG: hypothetical protein ABW023_12640 [Sphingomonas sp.]
MGIASVFGRVAIGVAALVAGRVPALADPSFSVSLPSAASNEPVTGRLIVVVAPTDTTEPRTKIGMNGPPSFGIDVEALKPGAAALVDQHAVG